MNTLKPTLKTEIAPIALIVIAWAASYYFYGRLPDSVPTHWNFSGEPDGWSSRGFASLFFPALVTGAYLLYLLVPALDPKRERYAEFRRPYHIFKACFVGLLVALYFAIGFAGLGYDVPVDTLATLLVGALLVVIGNYMGKLKQNWLFGIRTPWTLSSEAVWNKTHRLGGKLFIVAGVLVAMSLCSLCRSGCPCSSRR